jgi:hypothetical protein
MENMKYSREVVMRRGRRKEEMENWKRVLIAGSTGLSVMCFLKRRRAGGFIFGGVALAALASEYPEDFREIRANLPLYLERGATLLTVASRIGERLATVSEPRNSAWDEELV